MTNPNQILLTEGETAAALGISREDLAFLTQTRQLIPIELRGMKKFLRADLEHLARVYQTVQSRRALEQQ